MEHCIGNYSPTQFQEQKGGLKLPVADSYEHKGIKNNITHYISVKMYYNLVKFSFLKWIHLLFLEMITLKPSKAF